MEKLTLYFWFDHLRTQAPAAAQPCEIVPEKVKKEVDSRLESAMEEVLSKESLFHVARTL